MSYKNTNKNFSVDTQELMQTLVFIRERDLDVGIDRPRLSAFKKYSWTMPFSFMILHGCDFNWLLKA